MRVFDTLTFRIKELDDIFKNISPDVVYVGPKPIIADHAAMTVRTDNLYGLLAPLVATTYGCGHQILSISNLAQPETINFNKSGPIGRAAHYLWRIYPHCLSALRQGNFLQRVWKNIKPLIFSESLRDIGKDYIVITQDFMDPTPILNDFEVLTWFPGAIPTRFKTNCRLKLAPEPPHQIPKVNSEAIFQLPSFKALTKPFGHDVSDIASDLLRSFIDLEIPELYAQFETATTFLKECNAKAVLANNLGVMHARLIAAAANHLSIPVIVTPHGQIGDQHEVIWHYTDLRHADHYVLFTPDSMDYVQATFAPATQLHWAGCSRQDRVLEAKPSKEEICARYGLPADKPLVVYVTVPPSGNCQRLGVTVADTRSFETSKLILDAILAQGNHSVIIKGLMNDYPAKAPLLRYVQQLHDERVVYAGDLGFVNFIDAADCIVLDHPAYTVTESLTRSKPMYIFNETYHWRPGAIDLLKQDVVFILDREKFLDRLKQDLASGLAFVRHKPTFCFLRKWIDPYCDGTANQRLATVMTAIAKGTPYQLPPLPISEAR